MSTLAPSDPNQKTQPRLLDEEEDISKEELAEAKWWKGRSGVRRLVVLVAAMIIALQSNTTSAFNTFSGHIQEDTGLSDSQMTLLSSLGILGTTFTMFAGFFNDRFDAKITSIGGAILTSSAYLAMSFTGKETYPVMVICLTIVGFGSGACFLASLSTSLKIVPGYPGLGVALVGACMSISLALTNGIVSFYRNVIGCDTDDCWPNYIRALALTTAVFLFAPSFLLSLLPHEGKQRQPMDSTKLSTSIQDDSTPFDTDDHPTKKRSVIIYERLQAGQSSTPVGLLYSLNALRNVFFMLLNFAYFAGIGAASLILTNNRAVWLTFTQGENDSWAEHITTGFSIANTVANVLSGWTSDLCWVKFRWQRQKLVALTLLLNSIAYSILAGLSYSIDHPSTAAQIVFVVCVMCVGFCFGTDLSLVPIIVGDFYGYANFGLYFGYMQLGALVAVFLVPNLSQVIKQSTGDFNLMFVGLAACLLASFLGVMIKQPTPIGGRSHAYSELTRR